MKNNGITMTAVDLDVVIRLMMNVLLAFVVILQLCYLVIAESCVICVQRCSDDISSFAEYFWEWICPVSRHKWHRIDGNTVWIRDH